MAMFIIDRRINYNEEAAKESNRVTSELLGLNDNTSIKSELETVPENNPVKPAASTTTRPSVIIEGVPSSEPSPFMAETVLSEEASKVSALCDHLLVQQAEQTKMNKGIL